MGVEYGQHSHTSTKRSAFHSLTQRNLIRDNAQMGIW